MVVALSRSYVLDAARAVEYNRSFGADEAENDLLRQIADRKAEVQPEQDRFAALCDRWDNLYFPDDVLEHAGASHWAHHPSATTPGRTHISLNAPPTYIDVPASLQSVPPIENFVSNLPSEVGRGLASMAERLYFAWKEEEDWELKGHMACVVKALYGHTAAKVYWDEEEGRPCVSIVDQPRNLYLGWGSSDYTSLNWALYVYRLTREQVYENWGLVMDAEEDAGGNIIPFIKPVGRDQVITTARPWGATRLEVEVYDYWYRVPKQVKKKAGAYRSVKMETWNAIFVGNVMVKNSLHSEYDGKIPYIPLFNTYVPGVPGGRPELYDIENLIREKDERLTAGGQMLGRTVDGQYWQLVGPEAPDVVPSGVKPQPNKVTAPGAGNRIESITPWMPEFQLEAFLVRLDRELADVSGLNDLLRGLAPSTVLSSSKAITALVANYEARIRIKRDLYYKWRSDVWDMTTAVWGAKSAPLRPILSGMSRLQTTAPSLTPRDDMETASLAQNLVNGKLWSAKRGMDKVGVDDPETEFEEIKSERTDAAMFPGDVQIMAQLMALLQQLGYGAPPEAEEALGMQSQGLADMRQQFGGQTGVGPSMNAPEEQPMTPTEALPENVEGSLQSQSLTVPGEQPMNRIVAKQNIIGGG